MSTLVTILHIIVCLFLMLTVLLQPGKGGGMGGAFGGSNAGSVFGGAGSSTFLRRLTVAAATLFMLTSMVLAFLASRDAGDSLEKYSNSEASRRKRAQEAEKRAFEGANDAGVAPDGDAGVSSDPIDPATGLPPATGLTPDPALVPPTGAPVPPTRAAIPAGGAEVPAEIPAPAPAVPAGGAPASAAPAPAGPGSVDPSPALPTQPVAPANP